LTIYLEVGKKRVFASAVDWPGWCRSGRDEASALQALIDYAPRYAAVAGKAAGSFKAPAHPGDLHVTERLPGDATTDFGAPHIAAGTDSRPLQQAELGRLATLLEACWHAFAVVANAVCLDEVERRSARWRTRRRQDAGARAGR